MFKGGMKTKESFKCLACGSSDTIRFIMELGSQRSAGSVKTLSQKQNNTAMKKVI